MSVAAGSRIGKYVIEGELGRGGFGVIYVARDVGLERSVALKLLRREHVANGEVLQRFLQEARAAAKIDHPGIVTVHECGVDGETVYIAMELLRGETLTHRLARGPMPIASAVGVCAQAAAALAAAHRVAIVHRDLKPDNLMLCPDRAVVGGERVKVLDFGIAKLAESMWQSATSTHASVVLGTPMYMSPEQCRSTTRVDARSDVYALGCILYEMLCGRPPYDGDAGQLVAMHQLAPVPDPRALAPELPARLDALVRAMLAKEPEQRPQNMEQVEAELAACSGDAPIVSPPSWAPPPAAYVPPAGPGAPTMAGAIEPQANAQTTEPSASRVAAARSRRGVVIAGTAVAVVAIVLTIGVAAGVHPASSAAAAEATDAPPPPVVVAAVPADAAPPPPPAPAVDAAAPDAAPGAPLDAAVRAPTAPRPHAPPPPASPEKLACDAHVRDGDAAAASEQHSKAAIAYEAAVACRPGDASLIAQAYLEACRARFPKRARRFLAMLPATGATSQASVRAQCDRPAKHRPAATDE